MAYSKAMRSSAVIVAIALAVAFPTLGEACSMAEGYKVPTTLELVQKSRAIVLARVTGRIQPKEDFDRGEIILTPELLVAGTTIPGELRNRRLLWKDGRRPTRSDPKELARANPDAFSGGCNRYVFDQGMLLLIFVDQKPDGSHNVIDASFARTLEDVPDANALWVRAVRYYAGVVRLPKSAQKAAMQAEVARLRATGVADDELLAADIARQIKRKRTQNYD